jgi:hypothetical protein
MQNNLQINENKSLKELQVWHSISPQIAIIETEQKKPAIRGLFLFAGRGLPAKGLKTLETP